MQKQITRPHTTKRIVTRLTNGTIIMNIMGSAPACIHDAPHRRAHGPWHPSARDIVRACSHISRATICDTPRARVRCGGLPSDDASQQIRHSSTLRPAPSSHLCALGLWLCSDRAVVSRASQDTDWPDSGSSVAQLDGRAASDRLGAGRQQHALAPDREPEDDGGKDTDVERHREEHERVVQGDRQRVEGDVP